MRLSAVDKAQLERVQRAIKKQELTWHAGPTPIGRKFDPSLSRRFGYAKKGREPSGGRGRPSRQTFAFQAAAPPKKVDWRNVGRNSDWTTPVRDQGTCGSCVSFATCAVLESRMKIGEKDPNLEIDLSEAHLFFCGAGEYGCEEGWSTGQALKFCREQGVGSATAFRYQPQQVGCRPIDPLVRVPRWRRVSDHPQERREALFRRGPVIGAMVVYSDFLWYQWGVYRPTTAEIVGYHAIAVIGYDDDTGSWLVKNSWGAAWGQGGFANIGYGCCGLDAQYEFYDPEVEWWV